MRHLLEKFHDGISTSHGYAEVFENPTGRELRSLHPDNVGILVSDSKAFFWDRTVALHAAVISELGLKGTLPLLAHFDRGWGFYDAIVSDTVKGSKFDHAPWIRQFLEDHPYLGNFDLSNLDYYNGNVVGDWADLPDEDEEDTSFGMASDNDWGYDDPYGDRDPYGNSSAASAFLGSF